jgi:hypothetical protein
MKRNPDAMCGNCPMWSATDDSEWGVCRKESPLAELGDQYSRNYAIWPETKRGAWCGEHPDFAAPEPVVTCEHLDCNRAELLAELRAKVKGLMVLGFYSDLLDRDAVLALLED